jgi:hypothetical protein
MANWSSTNEAQLIKYSRNGQCLCKASNEYQTSNGGNDFRPHLNDFEVPSSNLSIAVLQARSSD